SGQPGPDVVSIARYNSGSLGYVLADAVAKNSDANPANDVTVSDLLIGAVADALYQKLGQPGLDVLRVVDRDTAGNPIFDSATGSPKLRHVTSASDVEIT